MASVPTGPAQPDASDLSIAADPSAYSATATMQLTIGLSAPTLSSVEQAVNNPGSPAYRQYLSYAETNALGVSPATQAALVAYLESYGLTVTGNDLSLGVTGTVAQIESALHTTIGAFEETYSGTAWNPVYDHVTGLNTTTGAFVYTSEPRVFYSTESSVELPGAFTSVISGISGLNGLFAEPQLSTPIISGVATAPGDQPNLVSVSSAAPSDPWVSSTSPGGAASVNLATGAANYTWNNTYLNGENLQMFFASTMPTLYGALPLWTGSGTLNGERDYGQGVTIALIEVGCLDPTILESFSNATWGNSAALMDRVTYIALGTDGTGVGNASGYDLGQCVEQGQYWGWSPETALDVEYSSTMAPEAHIDLISVPSADFTAFDAAYQFAAEYLIGNYQCSLPTTWQSIPLYPGGPAWSDVTVYGSTLDSFGGSACDASIFSNSYGTGEQYILYDGTSMYFAVENELLAAMAAEGGTSLFASGDGGGVYAMLNDFMPADSPAVTSVGGGQITALSGTDEFPDTNVWTNLTEEYETEDFFGSYYNYSYGLPVEVAPVTGTAAYTYWAGEETGTFDGQVAGGFGQSMTTSQGWWQNGLDTYSLGARIDPTVSGQAAFNMTIWFQECYSYVYVPGEWYYSYCEGPYLFLYGGTSFATPLMGGDLALVEEQLQVEYGSHDLGDANGLLYAAHNAFEAGATTINPYEPMVNMGCAIGAPLPDWCFANNFAWYYYNLSYQTPMDQGQPPWFATLDNPAVPAGWTPASQLGGSSLWNYLQGLGLPQASLLDKVLVGQTEYDHGLLSEPFYIEEVNSAGALVPFTTLVAGHTYTFHIVTRLGGNLPYSVAAYSGGGNNGTYGGGTTSSPKLSAGLTFTYTPIWVDPLGPGYQTAATTYGYFLATAFTSGYSNYWDFQFFAVAPPTPTVAPQLCVDSIYGICETGASEVTQFLAYDQGGWYNLQSPTVLVTENGLPVESATVVQQSVYTEFNDSRNDPTLNPAYYAPGQVIGTYVTDARGTAFAWTNAWTAELNGSLPTQVYTLTAYLDGVASNTVTVYVEPQSGSFFMDGLTMGTNGYITGTVYLNDMTNLEWANISLQVPAGTPLYSDEYVNQSFVNVNNQAMTVSLNTNELPDGTPAVVTATAQGWNNLGYFYTYCFFGYCYTYSYVDVQNPIVWQDPTVFLPGTISASATGTVTGTDTITWSGASYSGASGVLSLVSGSGTTVLATGTSGSYALDTTTLPDGSYSVTFTESAPGAVTSTHSVAIYANNVEAALENQLAADGSTISSLQTQVASIQASLNSANANVATLQGKVASLQGQLTSLNGDLQAAQSTIQTLTAERNANATEVASLQTTVTTDLGQIAQLTGEIQTLQSELNAKKNYVAPAWYDTFGTLGIALLVGLAALVVGVGAYIGGRRVGRKSTNPATGEGTPTSGTGDDSSAHGSFATTSTGPRTPESVITKAMTAVAVLQTEGRVDEATKLTEMAEHLAREAHTDPGRADFDMMYR